MYMYLFMYVYVYIYMCIHTLYKNRYIIITSPRIQLTTPLARVHVPPPRLAT